MLWIFVTLAVILVVLFSINRLLADKDFDKIPGPAGFPIIGNGLDFLQDQGRYDIHTRPTVIQLDKKTFYTLRYLANQYMNIFKLKAGHVKLCVMYDPEDIELLISGTKYNSKSFFYTFIKPWLQEGLLLSDGEKWRQRRKILTPAFHFNILRHFYYIILEKSNSLVKQISMLDNSKTDLLPPITDFTLHSICETAMGQKLDEEATDFAQSYKSAIHKLGEYILYRTQRVWIYPNFLFNLTSVARKQRSLIHMLSSFRDMVIKNRSTTDFKQLLEEQERSDVGEEMLGGKKRLAMLDVLLCAREQGIIDTKGICEEVDTFMFEGHDTTAAALQFIFMLLANNQEIQDKIIMEYIEEIGSTECDASITDLARLKFLECCIKESLRLYPPVPYFSRRCHEQLKLKNYTIPAGTEVTVLVYDLHRRSDIFSDPTVYRPERFMTDKLPWHPFAYIPFSAGPRNCIGQKFAFMEIKLAVTTVLRRFRLRPVTKPEDVVFVSDFILRSRDPIYVKFETR